MIVEPRLESPPAAVTAGVHARLVELFSDIFQVELTAAVADVARSSVESWDSFNHIRLVTEVEEAFGILLGDEEVVEITSLRTLEDLLARRGLTTLADGGA